MLKVKIQVLKKQNGILSAVTVGEISFDPATGKLTGDPMNNVVQYILSREVNLYHPIDEDGNGTVEVIFKEINPEGWIRNLNAEVKGADMWVTQAVES